MLGTGKTEPSLWGVGGAMIFLYKDECACKYTNHPRKALTGRQTKAEHGIWPKTASDYVILPGLCFCRMDNIFLFSLPLSKFHLGFLILIVSHLMGIST